MNTKVLLVEDSTSLAILYKEYVKNEPYEMFHVETGREAKQFIERYLPQLVILDLQLPDISGQEVLEWIQEKQFPTTVIIATAHGTIDVAVNLIQTGAKDFLEKPIKAERLKASIALNLENAKLTNLVNDLKSTLDRSQFQGFIGSSLAMQNVYKTIDAVAPTTASVFISGESGTGKEVCAEAIHKQSDRKNKPFVAINCGAIPRDLLESEVFGHVKGAFTGATADRKGAAMMANGGTLFLDELCEMELEMQKKLLRFLQTGTFTPLGASSECRVNIRIICATNRNPMKEVEKGNFREDLYYRVHVIPIEMPPLRERNEDIVELANYFLKQYAKLDKRQFIGLKRETEKILKKYRWPGNVRELQNVIRNIVVLNNDKYVSPAHLPAQFSKLPSKTDVAKAAPMPIISSEAENLTHVQDVLQNLTDAINTGNTADTKPQLTNTNVDIRPMWEIERDTIQQAIDYCDGNVLNAAVMLELSPSTVYRKKQSWESE